MDWVVPQFDPQLGAEEALAASDCVRSKWITEGPCCAEFVQEVKKVVGVPFGVLAPNGTLAIYLALKAAGIGPGHDVIVPDLTFVGTATAVVMAGATPVFADVDPYAQMDRESVRQMIQPVLREGRPLAYLPVHLYGFACRDYIDAGWAPAIEDACQALGVEYEGKPCGSFGLASAFSFFADKIVTTGEGGFVGCHDPDLYDRLCYLRNQGRKERGSFVHPEIGQNFRMTDLQASIGLSQIRRLPELITRRRAVHARYVAELSQSVEILGPPPGSSHVPFRTVVLVEGDAQEAMTYLEKCGIQSRSVFFPLHRQPCFQNLRWKGKPYADEAFPNSNMLYRRGLCLPTFPGITDQQIEAVCREIRAFVGGAR